MMAVVSRTYKDFSVKRIIIEKVIDRRLGFESSNPPPGWKWDHKHLVSDKISETLPMPGMKSPFLAGIPKGYWQNGPLAGKDGDSLEVKTIEEKWSNGRTRWIPIIHTGEAHIWKDSAYLFSDDSVVENIDPDSLDSSARTVHTLGKVLRTGSPIIATIYERKDGFGFLSWRNYSCRERFTGILEDGEELSTKTGDSITWANVDTTKREFVPFVTEDGIYLQFNRDVTENVTSSSIPSLIEDFNDLEFVGISPGNDDFKLKTRFFPLADDSTLACYVVDTVTGTWAEYTDVTTFSAANQVKIDKDVGILTFGTTASGSTPPPAPGTSIYLAYNAVPRIEYEEEGFSDTFEAKDSDVNPLSQGLNQGFVVLGRGDIEIASIVLSTTKASYGGSLDTYGPVYVGADYAALKATVYGNNGVTIPNIEVTFLLLTSASVGSLGRSGTTAQRITRADGSAYCSYVPPVSAEELGFFVTSVGVGNTLSASGEARFENVDDIYTYHVIKDDPWKGKVGADLSLGEIEWSASPPNGRKVIFYHWDLSAINPITGRWGAYAPVKPSSIDSSGSILTYPETLAAPYPYDDTQNLGAYWVVSDRYISVMAIATSPETGTVVSSNILTLRIEIPPYMKGDYIRDSLYTIPFGWRLTDDQYEVASAINGATYICINPYSGPYPIIDVISGETIEAYSDFWPYGAYPGDGTSRPFGYFSFTFTVA